MPTFFPRRFTNPEFLKTIAPENLLAFLAPFHADLATMGLKLPADGKGKIDDEKLISILAKGDPRMPKELVDGLYYVHEMSTPDAMNSLIETAPKGLFNFSGGVDPTPADVAITAWLKDRAFLEERHSERFIVRSKSFVFFQGGGKTRQKRLSLTEPTRRDMEEALDDWLEERRRGRGARIFLHPRGSEAWFLVRHGDPTRREGTYDNGKRGSVYYRPEKYDVLIYYYDLDRLGVHAQTQGEKKLYKRVFGKGLFADEDYFKHAVCFSLAPLRQKGETSLNCKNVNGLDSIMLKELEVHHPNSLSIVYKAPNLFQALGERSSDVLNSGDLWRASFNVKFSDHTTPRVMNLRPPAAASYMRDSDRLPIEEWMRDKKFLVVGSKHGKAGTPVGGD